MQALDSLDFSQPMRSRIQANIRNLEDRRQPPDRLHAAAVALTILHDGDEAAIILTRRASQMRAHRNQWSLPGGRIDEGENAEQAALREMREEINLSLDESDILGKLDDYTTRSGYVITPVVIWADVETGNLRANPDEVASIHTFKFSELSRNDSPYLESIAESDRPVLSMHFESDRVFAPTGALLYQFREVAIYGRATRVAHFEQPVFAWR